LLASGCIFVNGFKVSRSSLLLKPGDLITIKPKSNTTNISLSSDPSMWSSKFVAFSQNKVLSIVILRYPKISELKMFWSFNPQSCFAFYGKLINFL